MSQALQGLMEGERNYLRDFCAFLNEVVDLAEQSAGVAWGRCALVARARGSSRWFAGSVWLFSDRSLRFARSPTLRSRDSCDAVRDWSRAPPPIPGRYGCRFLPAPGIDRTPFAVELVENPLPGEPPGVRAVRVGWADRHRRAVTQLE